MRVRLHCNTILRDPFIKDSLTGHMDNIRVHAWGPNTCTQSLLGRGLLRVRDELHPGALSPGVLELFLRHGSLPANSAVPV